MRRTLMAGGAVSMLIGAVAWSCTGDDPINLRPNPDAAIVDGGNASDALLGADTSEASASDASDASPGACALRPFGVPQLIVGPAQLEYGPRLFGTGTSPHVMYAIQGGATRLDLYEAQAAGISPDAGFINPIALDALNSSDDEWAPAPNAAGDFVVFARGPYPHRDLFSATRNGTGFSSPTPLTAVNVLGDGGNDDDSDGYLVPDGTALFFGSTRVAPHTRIFRARRNGAEFDAPVLVLADATHNVTLPAVDGAQTTMIYARGATLMDFAIYEIALDGNGVAKGAPLAHPELVPTAPPYAPSFLSADGCTVYFQRLSSPGDVYVARR